MSRFLTWLNSVGTSQLLLGRQYGRFVEEFKRHWDREELRAALAPHRERFITVAKRADRYLREWSSAVESQVLATVPAGATAAAKRQLHVALAEFRKCIPDLTALSVRRPAWMLTGVQGRCAGLVAEFLDKMPKAVRSAVEEPLLRQVAQLGDRFWALLEQHRGNPWIAAEVIEEACNLRSATPGRRQFLQEWSLEAEHQPLPRADDEQGWATLRVLFDGSVCDLGAASTTWGQFLVHHLACITVHYEASEAAPSLTLEGGAEVQAGSEAPVAINPSLTYTLDELAKVTGWKKSTLRAAAKAQQLNSHRATGAPNAQYKIKGADFLSWEKTRSRDRYQ
ncbi:MAG: hypothetical protein ICCCNLDF_03395 [Planctomycetes bacterium]|nr:hypothetical protein [Planctomycetota bacterium]